MKHDKMIYEEIYKIPLWIKINISVMVIMFLALILWACCWRPPKNNMPIIEIAVDTCYLTKTNQLQDSIYILNNEIKYLRQQKDSLSRIVDKYKSIDRTLHGKHVCVKSINCVEVHHNRK